MICQYLFLFFIIVTQYFRVFQIFRICFFKDFIKNPQTTIALTFLAHIISGIDGVKSMNLNNGVAEVQLMTLITLLKGHQNLMEIPYPELVQQPVQAGLTKQIQTSQKIKEGNPDQLQTRKRRNPTKRNCYPMAGNGQLILELKPEVEIYRLHPVCKRKRVISTLISFYLHVLQLMPNLNVI